MTAIINNINKPEALGIAQVTYSNWKNYDFHTKSLRILNRVNSIPKVYEILTASFLLSYNLFDDQNRSENIIKINDYFSPEYKIKIDYKTYKENAYNVAIQDYKELMINYWIYHQKFYIWKESLRPYKTIVKFNDNIFKIQECFNKEPKFIEVAIFFPILLASNKNQYYLLDPNQLKEKNDPKWIKQNIKDNL